MNNYVIGKHNRPNRCTLPPPRPVHPNHGVKIKFENIVPPNKIVPTPRKKTIQAKKIPHKVQLMKIPPKWKLAKKIDQTHSHSKYFFPFSKDLNQMIIRYLQIDDLLVLRKVSKLWNINANQQLKFEASKLGKKEKGCGFQYIRKIFLEIDWLEKTQIFENMICYSENINKSQTLKNLCEEGNKEQWGKNLSKDNIKLLNFLREKKLIKEGIVILQKKPLIDQTIEKMRQLPLKCLSKIFCKNEIYSKEHKVFFLFMNSIYQKQHDDRTLESTSALKAAYNNKCEGVFKFLLKIGSNPNFTTCNIPFLSYVIKEKNFYYARLLLDTKNINVSLKDESGNSVLHYTAFAGWDEGIKILIEKKGIEINQRGGHAQTSLFLAVRKKRQSTVKSLLENKADLHIPDDLGNIPLKECFQNDHVGIFQLLLEHKANPNSSYFENGKNIGFIHAAIRNHRPHLVWWLIQRGGDIDYSGDGKTPLIWALVNNKFDIADMLIRLGADCNKTDEAGESSLGHAVLSNEHDIVNLLIQKKADVNKTGPNGPPLYHAVDHGLPKIVKTLLENKADLSGLEFKKK